MCVAQIAARVAGEKSQMSFAMRLQTVISRTFILAVACLGLTGCVMLGFDAPPRKEMIHAITTTNYLISFNAGQPYKLLSRRAVRGLEPGEQVLGIDYRVAKGVLYALGSTGRLYTINFDSGEATQVGAGTFAVPLSGTEFGFDFNPVVDRIRVVSDTGQNMRLHPDTGAVVDGDANAPGVQIDGVLAYAAGDANAGQAPRIAAAAYTYNKKDAKITTNFAIDAKLGTLVTQGTREGVTPAVSPNTGQLYTVGSLGGGEVQHVTFDIADLTGAAFAAFTKPGTQQSRFYLINLETGAATYLGTIGGIEAVRGISFQP
jgi:hypothetical protein